MKQSRVMLIGATLAAVLFVSLTVGAGDPFRKLGRGIVNVAFGALEVPMKIYDVNEEEGGLAAVSYGLFKGIGYFIAREVVGVTEIATFIAPLPGAVEEPRESGWGYGPLMEPEWVVDKRHDIYNIIYQDLPVN